MDIILEEFASKHNLNDRQIKLLKMHSPICVFKTHAISFDYKQSDGFLKPMQDAFEIATRVPEELPFFYTHGKEKNWGWCMRHPQIVQGEIAVLKQLFETLGVGILAYEDKLAFVEKEKSSVQETLDRHSTALKTLAQKRMDLVRLLMRNRKEYEPNHYYSKKNTKWYNADMERHLFSKTQQVIDEISDKLPRVDPAYGKILQHLQEVAQAIQNMVLERIGDPPLSFANEVADLLSVFGAHWTIFKLHNEHVKVETCDELQEFIQTKIMNIPLAPKDAWGSPLILKISDAMSEIYGMSEKLTGKLGSCLNAAIENTKPAKYNKRSVVNALHKFVGRWIIYRKLNRRNGDPTHCDKLVTYIVETLYGQKDTRYLQLDVDPDMYDLAVLYVITEDGDINRAKERGFDPSKFKLHGICLHNWVSKTMFVDLMYRHDDKNAIVRSEVIHAKDCACSKQGRVWHGPTCVVTFNNLALSELVRDELATSATIECWQNFRDMCTKIKIGNQLYESHGDHFNAIEG